tara:strand:- start:33 stop:215 length:183 start_codon:yes stop_codon:yes gene_type:complete
MTCYDCHAPAYEDEGYTFEGQLVCFGCYQELVFMALVNIDHDIDEWCDDVARSYGREVTI